MLKTFDGHTHQVNQVIELVNGNMASCSEDKSVNVWDRKTGEILFTLDDLEEPIK